MPYSDYLKRRVLHFHAMGLSPRAIAEALAAEGLSATRFLLNLLQAYSIALMHLSHIGSNASGHWWNWGQAWKIVFFMTKRPYFGKAGYLFEPKGVHFFIMSSPNTASLAKHCANVPGESLYK